MANGLRVSHGRLRARPMDTKPACDNQTSRRRSQMGQTAIPTSRTSLQKAQISPTSLQKGRIHLRLTSLPTALTAQAQAGWRFLFATLYTFVCFWSASANSGYDWVCVSCGSFLSFNVLSSPSLTLGHTFCLFVITFLPWCYGQCILIMFIHLLQVL